jgi:hypothetical protein
VTLGTKVTEVQDLPREKYDPKLGFWTLKDCSKEEKMN